MKPVEALKQALDYVADQGEFISADDILIVLESLGYTIYKKKVMRVQRRPASSTSMTPELKTAIQAAHAALPEARLQDIGNQFNVNQGRVSESLR